MRAAWLAPVIALLLAGVAGASTMNRPLQRGTSEGVRVSVYAPGRVIFDLTHARATVRGLLRGPQILPGCVKARLVNGIWRANGSGLGTNLRRRIQIDLGATTTPRGPAGFPAPYDGCQIGTLVGHRWNDAWGTRNAVEVWLTVPGRHFFNDRAAARDLAYFVRSGRVQKIRISANPRPGLESFVKRYPRRVVEMARAGGRVPKHVIGFWIGSKTIVFTTTSPTGRRLFVVAKRGTLKLPSKNLGDLAFVF
jgi:hypothetical protein